MVKSIAIPSFHPNQHGLDDKLQKLLAVRFKGLDGVKDQHGDRCQFESFPEGPLFLTNPPTVLVNSPGCSS